MPSFIPINDVNQQKLPKGVWSESVNFVSKGRTVDIKGKNYISTSRGVQYKILKKFEREYSNLEKIARRILGGTLVGISFGLLWLVKPIKKLITADKEKIRFGIAQDDPISKKELEKGVNISNETLEKIKTNLSIIKKGKDAGEVKFLGSSNDLNYRDFSLNSSPEYIFRMKVGEIEKVTYYLGSTPPFDHELEENEKESMKVRYQRMLEAQTVCRQNNLDQLVVPKAKLLKITVEGKEYEVIAEKKLDYNPSKHAQQEQYEDDSASISEAVRQLTVFTRETRYRSVAWKSNPILNNSVDEFGRRKLALLETEQATSYSWYYPFLEPWKERYLKLWEGVNDELAAIVQKGAEKEIPFFMSPFEHDDIDRRQWRREKVQKFKTSYEEYKKANKIATGKEPLKVDVKTLGFKLKKKGEILVLDEENPKIWHTQTITIEDVANQVIRTINNSIQNSSDDDAIKGKRRVKISYDVLLKDSVEINGKKPTILDPNAIHKRWTKKVLSALEEKKYIYACEKHRWDKDRCKIQA